MKFSSLPLILLTFLSFFLLTSFSSCSTHYPVISRVIPVPVPESSDTLSVVYLSDTIVVAAHTHLTDTVVKIEYFPRLQKIFYKLKNDTIFIPFSDTVFIPKLLEPPNPNYTLYIFAFFFVLLVFLVLYRFFPK